MCKFYRVELKVITGKLYCKSSRGSVKQQVMQAKDSEERAIGQLILFLKVSNFTQSPNDLREILKNQQYKIKIGLIFKLEY